MANRSVRFARRKSLPSRGIPPRSNCKVPEHPDYRRYRDRNRAERMFAKLKQQRRIAPRYDKSGLLFKSFLDLAAAGLWLKPVVDTAKRNRIRWDFRGP